MMTIKSLPKAELHVHIEGTITPELARKLADRNGITLPQALNGLSDRYHWDNFNHFLDGFDLVAGCIRTGLDYEDVVYDYLRRCAAEGVIYVEFFGSQDHGEQAGLNYPEMVGHLAAAIDRAEADFGIICRIIMTCIRHLGPERAVIVAQTTVDHPHPYVVGFGMAGDEKLHSCLDFKPAFDIVAATGLPCTAHAGEVVGPESITDALDNLPITRIGHGVRIVEDPAVLKRAIDAKIAFEVCPTSNIALKVFPTMAEHSLPKLLEAGCIVTLNSDDPPHFGCTIGGEYELAAAQWGLSRAQLIGFTKNAITASFADSQTKAKLLERLSGQE
ncbi:adenosine deaminase [Aestuariispira insulae]|uniref:Adenosine deaminase n=1 Tax=Aestuariispira insulae TaxID=1461337 RepID=A0A3D9HMY4_9PROT|nr:adenosine deaminase [Aestuariispira insulae]RED50860.1 adenosine deaminase [Aestuariispira insulae]